MDRSASEKTTVVIVKAPRNLVRKRECNRIYSKTRINIGRAFERWRELREQKRFKSDAEMAFFLLDTVDRVCGEHLSQDKPPRKRGRPRKVTATSQSEDSSQPSSDHHSDSEAQPSPDPRPTNDEVLGICCDLPSLWPYKPDKQAQPDRRNQDGSNLDVVVGSIAPSFVPHSSSSSATTEDKAINWEEIKDELAQTAQRLEERLDAMRSLSDGALEPISMTRGIDQKEVQWVVNKSSLKGLFRTCHQCGEPVLEFKTLTSGSLVRIQWECSKGHLMWLFPNYNPT
ncbi:uncharacterized protein si:ch211-40k21.5 isoform X2 [Pseudorasbora parva]|uniref:uncharacterized protein si:ch211-40k21.5 isoform X2 n=1 Tax=Pseudorasbora parva TaxID=51549 RepID=UPI00351E3ED1